MGKVMLSDNREEYTREKYRQIIKVFALKGWELFSEWLAIVSIWCNFENYLKLGNA